VLTPEQAELRELAREFAATGLRPHTHEWDAERALPDEIFRKVAEMGFLGMRVPEGSGGLGLDLTTYVLVLEALAWGDPSVALCVSIHNGPVAHAVARFGTAEQRDAWLPGMASGETLGGLALSEDETGSDTRAIATRAIRDGDGWRLSGTKRWVTGGERAGLLLVLARTSGEPGEEEGVSAFLVSPDPASIRVGPPERMLGFSAAGTVTLTFEELKLPPDALLGEEGRGYPLLAEALDLGRIGVAALALGISQAALEHALSYASERKQFETPIWEFGAIQEKLAGMATRIAAARALLLEVSGRVGADLDGSGGSEADDPLPGSRRAGAAMAKILASEAAMWITDEAVQVFGGYGYMKDYPVEKLMRDAKGTQIYHGQNQLLGLLVARDTVRAWTGAIPGSATDHR